jgi:hypothetical protein
MFVPNAYTVKEKDGSIYGLHKFSDGVVYLCMQHHCGDWLTIRPANDRDRLYFEKRGTKVDAVTKKAKSS